MKAVLIHHLKTFHAVYQITNQSRKENKNIKQTVD